MHGMLDRYCVKQTGVAICSRIWIKVVEKLTSWREVKKRKNRKKKSWITNHVNYIIFKGLSKPLKIFHKILQEGWRQFNCLLRSYWHWSTRVYADINFAGNGGSKVIKLFHNVESIVQFTSIWDPIRGMLLLVYDIHLNWPSFIGRSISAETLSLALKAALMFCLVRLMMVMSSAYIRNYTISLNIVPLRCTWVFQKTLFMT